MFLTRRRLWVIALEQRKRIQELNEIIEQQRLEHIRNVRDIVESFLLALDRPEDEDEMRVGLIAGLRDLNDHVARLEEHAQ